MNKVPVPQSRSAQTNFVRRALHSRPSSPLVSRMASRKCSAVGTAVGAEPRDHQRPADDSESQKSLRLRVLAVFSGEMEQPRGSTKAKARISMKPKAHGPDECSDAQP